MAISKRAAVATAVALLLGAAGAAFGFSTVDVPTQSDAAVSVGESSSTTPGVSSSGFSSAGSSSRF
ncbi:hypothetical protein KBP53_11070 [Corynebacterium genitalium ATCC 33030]|uniref:hypothetical protein n=1 Tax=Corynebacterium TaxID=1716 RepID=UPI0012EA4BB3|nr:MULTISPECIES: hypothetical protein [Corynebacterium]MCQ4623049.1 hypothetical protein [Corynebacterium sp. CCUG 70398]MCQ4624334.1 hypothetical protein [Corynebacterium sp. CCUG 69979]UUA89392.1 hypothetical protein KBP53_11070 [Corynebacterium genitalium ATCC 33030]